MCGSSPKYLGSTLSAHDAVQSQLKRTSPNFISVTGFLLKFALIASPIYVALDNSQTTILFDFNSHRKSR